MNPPNAPSVERDALQASGPMAVLTATIAAVSIGGLHPPTPHIVSARTPGVGELRLAHRYPLRDLTYAADPSGRGMLVFGMGRGVLVLSGPDADQTGPATYDLHLDVMQVGSTHKVTGDCALTLEEIGRVYRTVTCTGRVGDTGEAFTLAWRGSGAAAISVP